MTLKYILIVEDDTNLGNIYSLSLEHVGYETTLNRDGRDLCAMIVERRPDLLILDMHVPFSWGPETINKLRAKPEFADLKILVTTADIVVGHSLEREGERVLIKPVQVAHLVKVVEELLEA
ncbi:MAG: hypothetical protein DRI32_01690 [Chloroflexi bacterium]|nr:MAG: hypothetical protein DRI32_01690 [Chloroflexota bacterium]